MSRLGVAILTFVLIFPTVANSQQVVASNQAANVLAQSLTASTGSTAVSDVTLTGTAERIAGSDDETGTVTYRALPTANRSDLVLSGGTRSEIRASAMGGWSGNWIGPDGVVHEMALHNLFGDAGWFPAYTISFLLSSPASVLTYIGPETKNGTAVIHIRFAQQTQLKLPAAETDLLQHLTQMDFFLDAASFLPVALDLNIHPDSDANQDIPVEFAYSSYQTVGGVTIPFHVQQSINGSLFLDVHFAQISVNAGLSSNSTTFAIQ